MYRFARALRDIETLSAVDSSIICTCPGYNSCTFDWLSAVLLLLLVIISDDLGRRLAHLPTRLSARPACTRCLVSHAPADARAVYSGRLPPVPAAQPSVHPRPATPRGHLHNPKTVWSMSERIRGALRDALYRYTYTLLYSVVVCFSFDMQQSWMCYWCSLAVFVLWAMACQCRCSWCSLATW